MKDRLCTANTIEGQKHRIECVVKQRKIILADLAARMGMAQSTLSNIKRGRNQNGVTLMKLARELGVSTKWLRHGNLSGRRIPECVFEDSCSSLRDNTLNYE